MPTKRRNLTAWIAIVVTTIGALITAAVWAADEHSTIREWTAEQDYVTKTELKEVMVEQYVKQTEYKEDVTRLEERQKTIKEDVGEVKQMMKDIHSALPRHQRVNFNHGTE